MPDLHRQFAEQAGGDHQELVGSRCKIFRQQRRADGRRRSTVRVGRSPSWRSAKRVGESLQQREQRVDAESGQERDAKGNRGNLRRAGADTRHREPWVQNSWPSLLSIGLTDAPVSYNNRTLRPLKARNDRPDRR